MFSGKNVVVVVLFALIPSISLSMDPFEPEPMGRSPFKSFRQNYSLLKSNSLANFTDSLCDNPNSLMSDGQQPYGLNPDDFKEKYSKPLFPDVPKHLSVDEKNIKSLCDLVLRGMRIHCSVATIPCTVRRLNLFELEQTRAFYEDNNGEEICSENVGIFSKDLSGKRINRLIPNLSPCGENVPAFGYLRKAVKAGNIIPRDENRSVSNCSIKVVNSLPLKSSKLPSIITKSTKVQSKWKWIRIDGRVTKASN